MIKLAFTTVLLFIAHSAMADGFLSLGLGHDDIKADDTSVSIRQNMGASAYGGEDINDFWGFGVGLAHLNGTARQNSINYWASTNILYATVNGYIPLNDEFRLQAQVGGSLVSGSFSAQTSTTNKISGRDFGKAGFTYGVGAEYLLTEYFGVALEYMHFTNREKMTSINGTFHF